MSFLSIPISKRVGALVTALAILAAPAPCVRAESTPGAIRISEILAANLSGLADPVATPEDPEPLPWIELQNTGSVAVDLAGWSLSDDAGFPDQWVFPSKVIQPGQFLVVFASGLDLRNPSGTNRLHTNFKLGRNGEFLGLFAPGSPRPLVSGFAPEFPEQRNDRSYGYDPLGNLRYFNPPTPGAANGSSSIIGVAEPVHFSASRGHYTQPFHLTLSTPTPGALIRYTTDGREPTETVGQPYVTPLRLTNTTLLRAAAFRTNLLPSRIETHSYLFNIAAGVRSLPIISIVTDQNNLTGPNGIIGISNVVQNSDGSYRPNTNAQGQVLGYHNPSKHGIAWERPTSVELIQPSDNSGFQIDAGIRVQGSDYQRPRTTAASKFSYRLYFRSDYGSSKLNYPMFPLTTVDEFDQVVLRAGFNENSNPFIRDEITRRLSHDMGSIAAHGTMAVVFVNGQFVNGSPFYNPTERVHEEMLQAHLGGGEEWDVVGPDFAQSAGLPGVIDGDRTDFANLMTNFWGGSLRPITNDAAYVRVGKRLDLVNFADYCLLNAYVAMGDWPANNWRAGRERSTNGIWRYIAWDCEWAMGIYSLPVTRDSFAFSGSSTEDAGLNSTSTSEIARTYQALRANREFRLLLADRIQKHFFQGGALTGANISNRFDQLRRDLLGVIPSMDTEILTWARDRLPIIMTQFNTYGLYGYSNALHGVFASSNAPVFSQHGGRVAPGFAVSLTAPIPGSAIYYTLNGADPRVMFTGAISNDARLYDGPFVLNQPVQIRTRTLLNGTNWSALNEASFDVARAGIPLRITELHYNPSDSAANEFLELQNIGGAPVDLSGMYFDGITFTFNTGTALEPGARLVLATDASPAIFAASYPGVSVFGYYSGSLNNGGERITLFDRSGNIITSVDYDDAGAWPAPADGGGRSLELSDANGDPDDPANWQASSTNGGSPGTINPPAALPVVRLSEVMAENGGAVNHEGTFSDWIEIQNTGNTAANLSGWSLTDDANLRKFILPAGTVLAAQSYLTIWCDSAASITSGLHAGFALNRSGGTLALFDAGTNRVDVFSYGLQLTNVTVARITDTWRLANPTPGAANSAATTAPATSLVINEWQANAPAGQSDWIELHNTGAAPVELRGIYLSNTSAVHRVTSHSYVAAGGFVQLFADEQRGPDRLDFKLAATGGTIVLLDQAAAELDRVTYTNAVEGITRGRFPDATANIVSFPGSASPGASNYVNTYSGPVFNEVFARNQTVAFTDGRIADYVELLNPNATPASLAGLSLSVNSAEPGQFLFPSNTIVPANGYLIIWCDGDRPASLAANNLNTGRSLDGETGGAYLFNAQGQLVNSIEYGFQVADLPVGLTGGSWRLLAAVTPGSANASPAPLGTNRVLRINEWMPNPADGDDWFELFNSTNRPVELSGLTLTDDPTTIGFAQFRIPPLSFIGANEFVKWVADGNAGDRRNHVNFSLNDAGEFLGLYANPVATNFILIDAIAFEAQTLGVSEGRLPDGQPTFSRFPGSASPAASNYRALTSVRINEVVAHSSTAEGTAEAAIELFNSSATPINIGGWFLSDDATNFKKHRIADGTIIPAGGFLVVTESQLAASGLVIDSNHAGELWLSEADGAGTITGFRDGVKFGPSEHGVSFGPIPTTVDRDTAPLATVTLGQPNAAPKVGPVIISEIMYHPDTGGAEYIELQNLTANQLQLLAYARSPVLHTNTWRIDGGVEYAFPIGAWIDANSRLLIVEFNPLDPIALAAFRARHNIAVSTPIYGPFSGRLDNAGETLSLLEPKFIPSGSPLTNGAPYVRIDHVAFDNAAPWPAGDADGGGLSLQRLAGSRYGNEPTNWVAAIPTPGTVNANGFVTPPAIAVAPSSRSVLEGDSLSLDVEAAGAGPLGYQWRFNGIAVPAATNTSLQLGFVLLENDGLYDCVVSNPGGAAVSAAARLNVLAAPSVLIPPATQTNRTGSNTVFSVFARGSTPLNYQWRLNGSPLPGETNTTLTRNGILIADDGQYDVLVSNPVATTISSARLVVLSNTVITVNPPLNISVVTSSFFTISIQAAGNPLPFSYDWRRGSVPVLSNELFSRTSFVTLQAPTNLTSSQSYRVVVRNLANPGISANFQFFVTTLVDADVDGIPDNWENAHGLSPANSGDAGADADGDGSSNYQEYIAGTNPTNALSRLAVGIMVADGQAAVSFPAVSNRTYSIQFQEALNGEWLGLSEIIAQPGNRMEVFKDQTGVSNRFYRVVTPRQP